MMTKIQLGITTAVIAATVMAMSTVSEQAFARGGSPGVGINNPPVALTAAEAATLGFMREEEKLARDVYLRMYELWSSQIFANIAVSEQRHMDALLTQLQKYNLPDPAQDQGVFTNPELQALYDQLIALGSQSELDALQVGVLIEETDIEDLLAALEGTTTASLRQVYTNLLRGSENHLAAFTANIANQTN